MRAEEEKILQTLAGPIYFLAISQIARVWFSQFTRPHQAAGTAARRLSRAGWIEIHQILARPLVPLLGPMVSWQHGDEDPDFYWVSSQLSQRARVPAKLTRIVLATAKAHTMFGSGCNRKKLKLTQATHDLQVAEILFHYRQENRLADANWRSEEQLPANWFFKQRPDAWLTDASGSVIRALEYGGDYTPDRLYDLHVALASLAIPYEIW